MALAKVVVEESTIIEYSWIHYNNSQIFLGRLIIEDSSMNSFIMRTYYTFGK